MPRCKQYKTQVRKFLTFRKKLLIILTSVLTGCGMNQLSNPSTLSCVDMTTYVDSAKTAALVISKERICEMERLKATK